LNTLAVIDVSDPGAPEQVDTVEIDWWGKGIAAADGILYISAEPGHVQTYDLSDPAHPTLITIRYIGGAGDMTIAGDVVYVSDGGLRLADISTPGFPEPIHDFFADGGNVTVENGFAYMASWGSLLASRQASRPAALSGVLSVVDVRTPRATAQLGVIPRAEIEAAGDILMHDGYAFVTDDERGMKVVDLSEPGSPAVVATVVTGGTATRLARRGAYVFVSEEEGSVTAVDVSVPETPEIVGSIDVAPGFISLIEQVLVKGTDVIDISDPSAMTVIGTTNLPSAFRRRTVYREGVLYVPGDALYVLDVTNIEAPELLAQVPLPGPGRSVALAGSYAFVVTSESGQKGSLVVVSIEEPSSPVVVATISTLRRGSDIAVSGGIAYVARGEIGVQAVDVSDPSSPRPIGASHMVPSGTVVTDGEIVCVAAPCLLCDGFLVFASQCGEPIPVLVSGFSAEPRDRGVEVSWFTSFEYLHDGFHVYRSRTLELGYERLNRELIRGGGSHSYSYVDTTVRSSTTYYYRLGEVDRGGNEVFHPPVEVTTPAWDERAQLAAAPIPFRGETSLRFTMRVPGRAKLAVYDVTGRRVRVVLDEDLPEGDQRRSWDGRDETGRRVSGGTYFAELTAGETTETCRLVLLPARN
jgi:hypothetical protein